MSALFRTTRADEFDRLYRRHAPSVYRYAFAVLGNQADAEDVTQQTFLNAFRAIEQGTKPRKAENWLLTIAHNEVRRHFGRNGKAMVVEFDERLAHTTPEHSEPSFAEILRALRQLSPIQRSALVMREFEGRSYAEIAEILDVSQSALETHIFRARRALAEHLEEALTCTEAEQALSRRLDGRLSRREGRRLKAHLRECAPCMRFAAVQKRQRSLIKGLSVMPVPASLYLFRGEPAAAAIGGSAAAAGGTGIATGLVAKAAAVTAPATVAGGVGYGVTQAPLAQPKPDREPMAAAVATQRAAARTQVIAALSTQRPASVPAARVAARRERRKQARAKQRVQPFGRHRMTQETSAGLARRRQKPTVAAGVPPTTRRPENPAKAKAPTRPNPGKRLGPVKRPEVTPKGPPPVVEKPKPPRVPEPELPQNAAPAAPKKQPE